MNMSTSGDQTLEELYIACSAKQLADQCMAAPQKSLPSGALKYISHIADEQIRCCEGHAATVVAGASKDASMGYLMNLYQKGECEHSYLMDLYTK